MESYETQIKGRIDTPWDRLFIFHILTRLSGKEAINRVQKAAKQIAKFENPSETIALKSKNEDFELLGTFADPKLSQNLISKWNQPEGGLSYMCFTPNHGFAAVRNGKIDWMTLICFQCENAGLYGKAIEGPEIPPQLSLPENSWELCQLIEASLPARSFPIRS